MKKLSFAFVGLDFIKIFTKDHKIIVDFRQEGIRIINPEIISLLIKDSLQEFNVLNDELILIPTDEMIESSEKYYVNTKTKYQLDLQLENYSKKFVSAKSNSYQFSTTTTILDEQGRISTFDKILINKKYYSKQNLLLLDYKFWGQLVKNLNNSGAHVKNIMFPNFKNKLTFDNGIHFNISKHSSSVLVFGSGDLLDNIKIDFGLEKIISDISTEFNLSHDIACKLLQKFGHVLLEQKYYNIFIEVPFYKNMTQKIALTDLSFCLRNSVKEILGLLSISLQAKFKYILKGHTKISIESYVEIRGIKDYLELFLNSKVELVNEESINFDLLNNYYIEKLQGNCILEDEVKLAESLILLPKESKANSGLLNSQPQFLKKIRNYVQSGFENVFLETELR